MKMLTEQQMIDIFSLGIGNLTAKPFDDLVKIIEKEIHYNIKQNIVGYLATDTSTGRKYFIEFSENAEKYKQIERFEVIELYTLKDNHES